MSGLYGHINHIYEDHNLRFRDLKQIFKDLNAGNIDVYEKFDGQNLYIVWDFNEDKLKVARNKQNVKERGLDRYGLSLKFGDRPEVAESFLQAYDILDAAIRPIPHNSKVELFGSTGGIWFSVEIINPKLPNTIYYEKNSICFHKHGPILFSFDGEPIQTSLHRNLEVLDLLIPLLNQNIEKFDCIIYGPKAFDIKEMKESAINDSCRVIDKICMMAGVRENVSIREYLYKRLIEDMQRFPIVPQQTKVDVAKRLARQPGAPTLNEIYRGMDKMFTDQTKSMVDAEKKVILKLLAPIEACIHQFSIKFLSNIRSPFIEDVEFESARIKKLFNESCDILRNRNEESFVNQMMPKIGGGIVAIEGLVFTYRDKLYKITGSFAPMNRIIAQVKYGNKKKIVNKENKSLAQFIVAG